MANELMCLPQCVRPGHGEMEIRPIKSQTYEQKFCGVWYDCKHPGCHNSSLFLSKEIKEVFNCQPSNQPKR